MKNLAFVFLVVLTFTFISCNNSSKTNKKETEEIKASAESPKMKIEIFNNIDKTRQALSQNGIGELGKWKSDEMGGFLSLSNYYSFGTKSSVNGMENNLAYYLKSDNQNYIKTAKLVLNINNKKEKKEGKKTFKEITERTYKSLSIPMPLKLLESLDQDKNLEVENEVMVTTLKLDKSNIDSWYLVIKTK